MEKRTEIIEQLTILRTAIEASKKFVDNLPFFVRGAAVQDYTNSTGMSYEEWLHLIDSVLSALQAGTPLSQQALNDARKLVAYLERYAQYALAIPDKIRMASQFIPIGKEVIESAEHAPRLAEVARNLKQNLEALLKESQTSS